MTRNRLIFTVGALQFGGALISALQRGEMISLLALTVMAVTLALCSAWLDVMDKWRRDEMKAKYQEQVRPAGPGEPRR